MPWNVWNVTTEQWALLRSVRTEAQADYAMVTVFQREHPDQTFEVRPVHAVMEQHGTKLMQLKPSMVWQVAMDDLERRKHNLKADVTSMKPYAFHRKHVVKAATANDILRAAIEDPARGWNSSKRDTRLLYSDIDLLKAALQ